MRVITKAPARITKATIDAAWRQRSADTRLIVRRRPLCIRVECSSPGFQGREHARAVPDIIAYSAKLVTNRSIVAAFRPQFWVQHVVFDS